MLTRISLATAFALGLMTAPGVANEMNKDTQAGTMNQSSSETTGQGSLQSGQNGMQSANLQNRFSEFDSNGDGAISMQEWDAKKSELDGALSFSELNSKDDGQGEQKITRQEWNEHFGQQGVGTTGAGQPMDQQQDQQKQ